MSNIKKKHHFIPITYLNGFLDSLGKMYGYRKDDVFNPHYNLPKNFAFRKFYYSQPLEEGGWDHNTFEDFFSENIEGAWSVLRRKMIAQEKLSSNELKHLWMFNLASRVRVPALRDAVEHYLSIKILAATKKVDSLGLLAPKPAGLENIMDKLTVSIDPHQSIRTMDDMAFIISSIYERLGLEIIKNKTSIPFITSDNPVIYYDSSQSLIKPYSIDQNSREIEYLFPIDNFHLLKGHTNLKENFDKNGVSYQNENSTEQIIKYNNIISQFSYEWIFCSSREHEHLIHKHSSTSPVLEVPTILLVQGVLDLRKFIFGKRRTKIKWIEPTEE